MRISDWSSDVCSSDLPITAFGVRWPDDNRSAGGPSEFSGGGSGWLCEAGCDDWTTRQLVYTEKGAFGRMPWVTNLGASVMWTLPSDKVDLKARFSIYNLLDKQTEINVHSRYESTPGNKMPYFRSEEHTSELQSLMRISYAVFCLKKTKNHHNK